MVNFAADGTTIDSRFDYTYNALGLPRHADHPRRHLDLYL